jgi:hypothetical protein
MPAATSSRRAAPDATATPAALSPAATALDASRATGRHRQNLH